ncbi:prepilin peptidase [Allosphingosinicella flava]|uniref:Prepilin leader peptidase/N-methyltransferase n=1 Tax=Allosphingosinicella flava TaxID=2771430 RepID=A0A7T2LN38_9SPHN|nr:prepilin peptidase [Sphingosinicella flava]
MPAIGLAVAGAIAGSFLATILIRWPAGRSVSGGRSQCDGCGRTLDARDLIPLWSYLRARGQCRTCGSRIDPRHPGIEAAAALIGIAAAIAHPLPLAIATAFFGWWLLILAALDAEHQWLPDRLTLPLWMAGLLVALAGIGPPIGDRLTGSAIGFGGLFLLGAAYQIFRGRQGLGGGDPKLLGALGAWLGWQALPFLILIAALLGLIAVALAPLRGTIVDRQTRLPFGTYLALSGWLLWLVRA